MKWNKWIRQTHRWLTVVFTAAILINIVAIAMKKYSNGLGLMAVLLLGLLFFSGVYLFLLPYAARLQRAKPAGSRAVRDVVQ
jgi:hypothetical protein